MEKTIEKLQKLENSLSPFPDSLVMNSSPEDWKIVMNRIRVEIHSIIKEWEEKTTNKK
jgi:hypothetical protein